MKPYTSELGNQNGMQREIVEWYASMGKIKKFFFWAAIFSPYLLAAILVGICWTV